MRAICAAVMPACQHRRDDNHLSRLDTVGVQPVRAQDRREAGFAVTTRQRQQRLAWTYRRARQH